jgi:phytoene/squalene synthetase
MYRRRSRKKSRRDDDDDDSEEDDEDQAPAPPAKMGVAIVSTIDGKTANVKVPSNMPVNKLLQNCVGKFPLPHANFAVMLNGVAVDLNLSLEDAGLTDGCQVDLVPLE